MSVKLYFSVLNDQNQPSNNVLVFPSKFMTKTLDRAVFATWLEAENAKSLWNNNTLLLVVWWWNALEALKAVHGGGSTGSFMWNHAADGSLEDFGGCAEMEWTFALCEFRSNSIMLLHLGVFSCSYLRESGCIE
jgi:hypothetical protein